MSPAALTFFTVNLLNRQSTLLVDEVDKLRRAFAIVRKRRPCDVPAIVILPDHFHCIMVLPPGDTDFSSRLKEIKTEFSRSLPCGESINLSRARNGERGIWQRRFFEHVIRNDEDLENHVNYIHFNPVKHGHVTRPVDWEFSSIHRFVERGWCTDRWGGRWL